MFHNIATYKEVFIMKEYKLLAIFFAISLLVSCSVKATKSVEINKSNQTNNKNPIQEIDLIPETFKNEKLIWKGESGDYQIHWTEKDIYIEKGGKTKKLFTDLAKKHYDINFKYKTDYSEKLQKFIRTKEFNSCLISMNGQITSLAGNFLTLEIEEYYMCGVVQYYTTWVVFDLDNLDKAGFEKFNKDGYARAYGIKITDIFDDQKVLAELLKNKEIKESIGAIEKDFQPKSTLELLQWFQDKEEEYRDPDIKNKSFTGEDIFFENVNGSSLNKRALTEFNFERIENSKVVVRLGLEPNYKQHGNDSIEIELEIPEKLKQQFKQANLRKKGFLGSELFKNEFSIIDFENGKEIK